MEQQNSKQNEEKGERGHGVVEFVSVVARSKTKFESLTTYKANQHVENVPECTKILSLSQPLNVKDHVSKIKLIKM
jgi:hypothetical protein